MLGHKMLMAAAGAIKKGIQGVFAGSTVIATASASTATAYSNQRKIDRCQNGVLWMIYAVDSNTLAVRHSLDQGETWDSGAVFPNGSGSTASSYTLNASLFIDVDDYAHVVFKDNSNGYIYYVRGTPNAARTSWSWSSAVTVNNTDYYDYPDVIAHNEGSGWAAHIVYSRADGSSDRVVYARISIESDGNASRDGFPSSISGDYGNTRHKWPSIDFHHTGDGKTVKDGEPHLFVAWSAGATGSGLGIRFKKATYSSGSWSWGSEREIDSTVTAINSNGTVTVLFDGTRVVITKGQHGKIWDRDVADTVTTSYTDLPSESRTFTGNFSYDSDGNLYFVGVSGASGGPVRLTRWARSTGTVDVEEIDPGSNQSFHTVSAKRGYSNNRIEFVYTDGSSSPYDVTYGAIE